jgi:S1-C subfamily serine protease
MQALRLFSLIAFCLIFVSACASAPKPIVQPPAPFPLVAHDTNVLVSVRIDVVESGQGSGVIISKNGLVLTNEHVIRRAGSSAIIVVIKRADGTEANFMSTVIAKDPARDLALLRVSGLTPKSAVSFADDKEVHAGDLTYGIGYPGGRGPTTVWGKVVTVPFFVDMRPAEPANFKAGLLVTLPANDGSSGQPVFSATTGKLIAVHKLSLNSASGAKSVLISVVEIRHFLAENGISLETEAI